MSSPGSEQTNTAFRAFGARTLAQANNGRNLGGGEPPRAQRTVATKDTKSTKRKGTKTFFYKTILLIPSFMVVWLKFKRYPRRRPVVFKYEITFASWISCSVATAFNSTITQPPTIRSIRWPGMFTPL